LLIDDPRGEPEDVGTFHVGQQVISLLWLVPIYGAEVEFIRKHGVEAFDALCAEAELSLVDVSRRSFA